MYLNKHNYSTVHENKTYPLFTHAWYMYLYINLLTLKEVSMMPVVCTRDLRTSCSSGTYPGERRRSRFSK